MNEQTAVLRNTTRRRSREEGTRKLPARPPPGWARLFERIVLMAVAMDKARAAELLDALAGPHRDAALILLQRLLELDSTARQGRIAQEFRERADALEQLRLLLPALPDVLQRAVLRRLPPHLRSAVPADDRAKGAADPDTVDAALADRLVREAIR